MIYQTDEIISDPEVRLYHNHHPCEPPLAQEADVDEAAAEAVEVAHLKRYGMHWVVCK